MHVKAIDIFALHQIRLLFGLFYRIWKCSKNASLREMWCSTVCGIRSNWRNGLACKKYSNNNLIFVGEYKMHEMSWMHETSNCTVMVWICIHHFQVLKKIGLAACSQNRMQFFLHWCINLVINSRELAEIQRMKLKFIENPRTNNCTCILNWIEHCYLVFEHVYVCLYPCCRLPGYITANAMPGSCSCCRHYTHNRTGSEFHERITLHGRWQKMHTAHYIRIRYVNSSYAIITIMIAGTQSILLYC